jgi:hypothetical protein
MLDPFWMTYFILYYYSALDPTVLFLVMGVLAPFLMFLFFYVCIFNKFAE